MPKYHISSTGLPSRCNASIRDCPVGGAHGEFEDAAAAREWTEEVLAKQYGIKSEKKPKKSSAKKAPDRGALTPLERQAAEVKVNEMLAEAEKKMDKHYKTMSAPIFDEFDGQASWAAQERSNYLGAYASRLRTLQAAVSNKTDKSLIIEQALDLSEEAPNMPRGSDSFQAWQASQQAIGDFLNAYDPESNDSKTFNDRLDNNVKWHYEL